MGKYKNNFLFFEEKKFYFITIFGATTTLVITQGLRPQFPYYLHMISTKIQYFAQRHLHMYIHTNMNSQQLQPQPLNYIFFLFHWHPPPLPFSLSREEVYVHHLSSENNIQIFFHIINHFRLAKHKLPPAPLPSLRTASDEKENHIKRKRSGCLRR